MLGQVDLGDRLVRDVVRLLEAKRPQSQRMDPLARASLIVTHVQTLAREASVANAGSITAAQLVRRIIEARAHRRKCFDDHLFADPAWDILLELYALRCEQRRTSVSKLCVASGVPSTTALRWIERLLKDGLIERSADPLDGRRVWVSISDQGYDAMQKCLEASAESLFHL